MTRFLALAIAYLLSVPATALAQAEFVDVTESVGLRFRHDPLGETGTSFHMPAIMGSGGALFDFDDDGDLDIYLVQAAPSAPNRLFRQEADGAFVDVTAESGLGDAGFGMGVAIGDVHNDGRLDVLVTNDGPDALYRNLGGGVFENVTDDAGIGGGGWSASAVFCDYDADGDLDLYVTRYVDYHTDKACFKRDGGRDFCGPQEFDGVADVLYRNDGDGSFTDVSEASGVASVRAPGLGVLCLDLNGDHRLDFYVANDGKANQMWLNDGGGKFVDDAYLLGGALNAFGKEEAGMGVGPGDVDNDGDLDLFLTHLRNESNTLYRNDGELGFEDATHHAGLGSMGLQTTGFGVSVFDFDHDGRLDIAVANGRVAWAPSHPESASDAPFRPYAERNAMLRNVADGEFETVGGGFASPVDVSRGLATGDIDGDGDLDLLVTNTAGPARLFRNGAVKRGRWLIVRTLDPGLKRDAHGAVVTVTVAGRDYVRLANPGYGYLSSSDPRAHVGLPAEGAFESLTVRWPDGSVGAFDVEGLDRVVVVRKGEGR